ncbi:MAG: hypothetical protein JSS87_10910 [Acidobacteria bacterium]|nr:hypothetical protein [Acidobacteriota bacterium]
MKIVHMMLAGALIAGPAYAPVLAQTSTQMDSQTATADVSDNQLVTMTVHEAWVASGRNEDKFFDFVKRIADMSATKRGVTLPDSEAAGTKFGDLIKTSARRDPDQLLYAVVDNAVKTTAGAGARATRAANRTKK